MSAVFISHRGADRVLATRLAQQLRDRGHNVWLDDWEIVVGDSIVKKINLGLDRADAVVLCLSSTGLSDWVDREWMSTLARQLEGAGVRLIPARLSGEKPPAILADIKAADLTQDWNGGVDAICAALTKVA